ncbi:FecCD family ABC transporter permease [Sphingomonas nostoxanthinifaciens]|uniref:FecCD family ABC transporter permease n=1 Tax=Sphingomonas nostoxanthinifaciens TaxID=2872652 RepID=UPI001CC1E032|nr:iron ABC transporter permease [Sphingomonas nostoxanthinifaciens]UAK25818.1 iron ABC transporter permease [Sphingomonas nostoxanthinifaciens]
MSRGLLFSILLLVIVMAGAACIGRYPIPPVHLLRALGLGGAAGDPIATTLLWHERLPRILGAALVGAGLASAGAAYQGVFRNPLVSPDLLGVLAGSGFGAAAAILLDLPPVARMALTFAGGGAAVALGVLVARLFADRDGESAGGVLLLVFGGLVSGALFTALLSLAKFVADPQNTLADIVFWLLGSLTGAAGPTLAIAGVPLAIGIALLIGCGRFLDLLVLADDEALSLGVPVRRLRLAVIAIATATCALTVTLAGTIGWVGLVVPHIVRLLTGPAHGRLMPICACIGAVFLVIADTIARTVTPSEIPIGIVTDLVGVIVFLAVLPRLRRGWA